MPELLLELFSEEIPARMQARGAEDLARLLGEALGALAPSSVRTFYGPRRIAYAADVSGGVAESRHSERGPRVAAPEQALAGFLRKHGAARDELRQDGAFWVLDRIRPGQSAAALIAQEIPTLLRRFPWPKSMRWGGTSAFTWVRPLRRILCILDGAVVPFDLRQGDDDGHGLASGNLTEGHRFLSPGAFAVSSAAQWQQELLARHVIADPAARRDAVRDGIAVKAAEQGLSVVPDDGLLDEVTGLVEWPVALLGRIGAEYMDLPPEVMQVSMRVNQRYFALRDAAGNAAPWFAFAANIDARDGGAAIVAGNERVLRARFSDARHFWDLDRRQTLESRVPELDAITFHAKLGSQGDRVRRLVRITSEIASLIGANEAKAQRAALLSKADLTTGMVGEFPELQGVMGGYYARHDGEGTGVSEAVRDHYAPRGADDQVPRDRISVSVALADKLDQLCAFFGVGERPTGSSDPFALRRAALGIIRIVLDNALRLPLMPLIRVACEPLASKPAPREIADFIFERMRVQLRSEGRRHDVLAAVLAAQGDDDLARVMSRSEAVGRLLTSEDGRNLLGGYKRARNIVLKESRGGETFSDEVSTVLLQEPAEQALYDDLETVDRDVFHALSEERYDDAITAFAQLRYPIDRFFEQVTVNVPARELRANRLALLERTTERMDRIADFSKIEG